MDNQIISRLLGGFHFAPVKMAMGMCLLLCLLAKPAPAVETDQSLVDKITRSAVLYQPLMWVGSTPPSEKENQVLYAEVENMKKHGVAASIVVLNQFIDTHPDSPWVPSLRANLGRYDFEHGLYTKALQNWELAWTATKDAKDRSAKRVADFTFAYWTRLLASLGRMDTLKSLYQETQGRLFDGGPLQQLVNGAKEGYHVMLTDPGVCFKCGTFALNNVGRSLKGPSSFDSEKILQIPSPTTGFSMAKLEELAKQQGLDLVAAKWGDDRTLIVPSVVHWKENHYVAILQERNGHYLVADPTFGKPHWLSASDIQEEASGYFMVSKDRVPKGWKLLALPETGQIFGRGYVYGAPDSDDGCGNGSGGSSGGGGGDGGGVSALACGTCGGRGGNTAGGSTGGDGSSCPTCPAGMTVWEVSEPCINVWLYDEPLGYQPAIGGRISFKLAYKQRESRAISSSFFSYGPMWDCSWLTYIQDDGYGYSATMQVAGGGERTYTPDNTTREYHSHTLLQRTTDGVGNLTGFIVSHENGAKDYYNFIPSELLDAQQVAFLTSKVDPFGHATRFVYQDAGGTVLLKYVVDTDGRTNTLAYNNAGYPAQITGIQDPFGRSAALTYDSNGVLTNITDVVGISSSFKYDAQGWVTNLLTPYGLTSFGYWTNNTEPAAGEFGNYDDGVYNPYLPVRAVKVTDAVGGTNIYMLRQDSRLIYTNWNDYYTNAGNYILFLPFNYDGSIVPQYPNVPVIVGNHYLYYRDSFHWGPRQVGGLPGDLTTFAPSDFLKARMRHWLHDKITYNLSQTLEMEQAPSPDGATCGQTTWYTYYGQGGSVLEGLDSQPELIARVVPDGTTWYTWYERDEWGRPTTVVKTFSSGYGAIPDIRTHAYVYDDNGVNLIQKISPEGETTSYGYDANNNLLFVTNALNEVIAYTYDNQGRRTSTKTPSGLITTNVYFTSGIYTNYLQTTIDLGVNRTNSYTYTNDLVYSHIDERGLATTNVWDNLNRLIKVMYPDGTYITNSYYRLDLVKMVDRMGFATSYGYDNVRRKIAETNAVGAVTLFNYCSCGSLESIRDAVGNFTSFDYDNAGHLLSTTYPDGYVVYNNYDLMGRVTNTVDSGGVSTTFWYNNQGLRYAVSNAVGQVSLLAFDLDDRVTNNVDANNVSVDMTYDPLGRLLSRTYPDTGVETYGYTFNISGPTSYTNQIGNVVQYAYDTMNRKTNEIYAGVTTNKFAYNGAGDLLTLTDGKQQVTAWGYDVFGRVTNKVDAASNLLFVYAYDPDNRLTNRWSTAKGGTTYRYDPVGNLTNVDYPVSPDITLKYDKLNRLTNMVDAVGTTVYGYDAVGQVLSEDGPWINDTVSYTYANRLRTGLSVLAPNASAWTQTYGYDAARRLTSATSPAGEFDYAYDPVQMQRLDSLMLPGGAYITNTFDNVARLRMTELLTSRGTNLDSYTYGYNQANQRTNVMRTAGDYVNYSYDNMGELKTAIGKEAGGVTNRWQEQFGYAYDAAGNLNFRTNNALLQTFNVNSLNELTTTTNTGRLTVAGTTTSPATNVTVNTSNAVIYADVTFASTNQPWVNGNNTFTAIAKDSYGRKDTNTITVLQATNVYTYDLNGNLLYDGRRAFDYDDENQLIRVTVTNGWKSEFTYDGKLRRRIVKEFTWNGSWQQTNEVHFIYDGNLVVQERDASNLPQVSYTRGNGLNGSLQGAGGIGGLLARTANPSTISSQLSTFGTAFYHADGNGNVTCLIYTNQMIAAKYLYDPFGNTLSQYGSLADANTYRFSSKEWNANSGLYYYLFRFYDPNLQKWVNRDPIEEKGGINLYRFCVNPISQIDPDGRQIQIIPLILRQCVKKGVNSSSGGLGGRYHPYGCTQIGSGTWHDPLVGIDIKVCSYICYQGGYDDECTGQPNHVTEQADCNGNCPSSPSSYPPIPTFPRH